MKGRFGLGGAEMTARKGSVKKVFPGGNTSQGFYSFYDHIITPDATRIMVIKGGPGVGKSTFMRRIAEAMVERGFDVEFHMCASDNNSIDGVVIPAIGVALIDGTAPHVIDPRHPGCVDEIIHLGDYWNENGLRARKRDIIECNHEITGCFQSAFRFLKAAQAVYEDWERANMEAMNFGRANRKADDLLREIYGQARVSTRVGRERHLFASAITPDGMKNYLDTIVAPCTRKYIIEGEPGTGKSTLLQKIATAGLERGFHVELYHCPLNPAKVEHIVIPLLGVALTKSIEPHPYTPAPHDTVVNMNEFLDPAVTARRATRITEDQRVFDILFDRAIWFIGQAKAEHDRLEVWYTSNMDFEGISSLWQKTLNRILGYAEEVLSRTG